MTKKEPIIGGFRHQCDVCDTGDGRPTLYWKDKDFDICEPCIESLSEKINER